VTPEPAQREETPSMAKWDKEEVDDVVRANKHLQDQAAEQQQAEVDAAVKEQDDQLRGKS
jgi:hypothetical protein